MKPSLYTFDAHEINDGTNYVGKIPLATPLQATEADGIFVKRAGATPVLTGTELSDSELVITITCRGANVFTQFQTLNQWFNVYDETAKQLIVKDTDNSDKQYYIYCTVKKVDKVVGKDTLKITLLRKDPIWKSVTENSTSWAITASGQTQAITNGGNIEAYPKFEFTPTSYPSGGFGYSRKVLAYPTSSYFYSKRALEILGGLDTAALVSDATVSNRINDGDGITAGDTTIDIDTAVGGGLPAAGTGYVGTEQISWTANSGTQLTGVTRGVGGTTAAVHADDAVITRSLVLANGDDFRVLVDGVEVDRWFGTGAGAFNTAATLCWIAINMPAKRNTTLKTAISDTGTPTYIDINLTTANTTAISAMPATGLVLIGTEEFSYQSKVITATALRLRVNERAVRNTVAAAHAANVSVIWIPYDIQVAYGNTSASAPDIDNTYKPAINLETSTNSSFVYASFYDITNPKGQRAAAWMPTLISTSGKLLSESGVYYGENMAADTDPAEVMGMLVSTYISNGLYRAETASIEWRIRIPDGVSAVSSSGYKYRTKTSWATVARLQSSVDGITWVNEWAATEATPASATTWTAWTHNAESVPNTSRLLRFYTNGSVTAVSGNYFAFEVTSATLTLVNAPTVSLRAQESNYYLSATITNTTTGDYLTIAYPLQTNSTLYIDTDPNQPYAKRSGRLVNVVNPDTNRSKWLALAVGSNTLTFTATANNNITCVVKWNDRMNFL